LAILAVAFLAGAPVAAMGAESQAEGSFSGTIGLEGGWIVSSGLGTFTVNARGSGSIDIELSAGTMQGTWVMSGGTDMTGPNEMNGTSTFSAEGTASGNPSQYRLEGVNRWTSSVNMFGLTSTESGSEAVSEPLTNVVVLCDRIVGRWDSRIGQALETVPGVTQFLHGYLMASLHETPAEIAAAVDTLHGDIRSWAAGAAGATVVDAIGEGIALMARTWRLQDELGAPAPCPPDPRFLTDLTLAAQTVLATLLDLYPGQIAIWSVPLALATGAIGAGSAAPEEAAALEAAMQADVQLAFTQQTEPGIEMNISSLHSIAVAAQSLGMDTLTTAAGMEWSPADILLAFGGTG
jgi:hypothetical protein